MPTLTIDGKQVEAAAGSTVLAAAAAVGVRIPTLCHLEGIEPLATCMVCLVEERASGRLVPSCATRVEEGMRIETSSDLAQDARRKALELLLSEHAGECVAPCERACPLGIDIPELLDALEREGMAAAWQLLRDTAALPATAAHLCSAGCEKACRRREVDTPVRVGRLHAEIAHWGLTHGQAHPRLCEAASGKHVVIVGAGPAGLAAADVLLAHGHRCTLYEQTTVAGGSLCGALVAGSRDARTLADEIESVVGRAALRLRLGVRVGVDVSWGDAKAECDVLLVTTGHAPPPAPDLGLDVTDGQVSVEAGTWATAAARVFAAGAVAGSGRDPLRAMASGRDAGQAIHRVLVGASVPPCKAPEHDETGHYPAESRIVLPPFGRLRHHDTSERAVPARRAQAVLGALAPEELHTLAANRARRNADATAREHRGDATSISIAAEARRCLGCGCRSAGACDLQQLCAERGVEPRRTTGARRTIEPVDEHPVVRYEPGKCILCGRCVRLSELAGEPLGLAVTGRGFATRVRVPLGRTLAQSLERSAAACAEACPTGALTLRADLKKESA